MSQDQRSDGGTKTGKEFWLHLLSKGKKMGRRKNIPAAPVGSFSHVPASYEYDSNIVKGLIVEAIHQMTASAMILWLCIVRSVAGYYVELTWLGDSDPDRSFWRNIASYREPLKNELDERVRPVGWAVANNHRLQPPEFLQGNQRDWARLLEELPTANNSLGEDFFDVLKEENECVFRPGMIAEVVALDNITAMTPAVIEGVIGRRIKFRRLDCAAERPVCWFHEFDRDLVAPSGWAVIHGRELISTQEYREESRTNMLRFAEFSDDDASIFQYKPHLMAEPIARALENYQFEEGAKLELIDPLENEKISVGTIRAVLANQLLEIGVDGAVAPDGSEHRVIVHATSPVLLYAGFAAEHGLKKYFQPPTADFSYDGHRTVPRELLLKMIPSHGLETGQYLEAIGVSGTNLLYVCRIVRVVGHLVIIHFEGYPSSEDQFFPITSPDLYPMGWADMVGHPLRTPPLRNNGPMVNSRTRGIRRRN